MKIKRMLIWVLPALVALALAGLNCGEKADPSTFAARDPVWSAKNPGITKTQNYCEDKNDNDGDGTADYYGVPPHCAETDVSTCVYEPDPKCAREIGGVLSQGEAACSDNLDNDGDTTVDKGDPDCWNPYFHPWLDQAERGYECSDGIDNDGDFLRDFGVDNDGDGIPDDPLVTNIDMDPSCASLSDSTEESPYLTTVTDGICNSSSLGDDNQRIRTGNGVSDSICVTDGGNLILGIIANSTCVTDGGDLILRALVGDDVYLPAGCVAPVFATSTPGTCTSISSGSNGICQTAADGVDDIQVLAVGWVILGSGGDDEFLPAGCTLPSTGPPVVLGTCTSVSSGGNGICETAADGLDDTQVIAVGQGSPNQACVDAGEDGVLQTVVNAADTRISH